MIKFMIFLSVIASLFFLSGVAAIALRTPHTPTLNVIGGGLMGAFIVGWVVVWLARKENKGA